MILGVRLPIDGQRPSSFTGVAKGVLPRVNEGVRDKFTRGLLLNVRDASLILVGKLSGFGGRFNDIDRVSEVDMSEIFCGMTSGAFVVLSLDRALSRVASCGALDLIESETDRFTDGRERVLDVDSFDRRGDLFVPSFMATFFFAVAFNLRMVASPVIEEDSLPPSLA